MDYRPGTKSRVINREVDLRVLLASLQAKPFAISPPIEVENSFMMGLANEDLHEGVCIHVPLSALSGVSTLLFTMGDKDKPIYAHSLKQTINWFYRRNILIPTERCQDVSIAAYLLKPPESDKGEDWQEFLLSSLVRDHLGRQHPYLPRRVERSGYPEVPFDRLAEDACSVWAIGEKLIRELRSDSQLYRLHTDAEMTLVSVLAEMERDGIGVDLPKIRQAWPRVENPPNRAHTESPLMGKLASTHVGAPRAVPRDSYQN